MLHSAQLHHPEIIRSDRAAQGCNRRRRGHGARHRRAVRRRGRRHRECSSGDLRDGDGHRASSRALERRRVTGQRIDLVRQRRGHRRQARSAHGMGERRTRRPREGDAPGARRRRAAENDRRARRRGGVQCPAGKHAHRIKDRDGSAGQLRECDGRTLGHRRVARHAVQLHRESGRHVAQRSGRRREGVVRSVQPHGPGPANRHRARDREQRGLRRAGVDDRRDRPDFQGGGKWSGTVHRDGAAAAARGVAGEGVDLVLQLLRHLRQSVVVVHRHGLFVSIYGDDPLVVLHHATVQCEHRAREADHWEIRLHRRAFNRRAAGRSRPGDAELRRERCRAADAQRRAGARRSIGVRNRGQQSRGDIRQDRRGRHERILNAAQRDDPALAHHRRAGHRDVHREEFHRRTIRPLRFHGARHVAGLLDELRDTAQRETVRVINLQRAARHRRRVARRQRGLQSLRHLRQRRDSRQHFIGVVARAQVQRPLVALGHRAVQGEAEAREIRLRILAAGQAAQRGRVQHLGGDLELEHVEASIAGTLDARVRRLEINVAAQVLVAHEQIVEREEFVRRLNVLRGVVAAFILGDRFRREDESVHRMRLQRDLQLIVRALRNAAERQPVAHLDVVGAFLGEGVLQEIIQPRRAAARARLQRIREARSLRKQATIAIQQPQPARPDRRVANLEAVVDVEDRRHRVPAVRQHLVRDAELVEVRVRVSFSEDRQVRQRRRGKDVRVRHLVPLAEVNVLRVVDGIMHGDFVQHGRAEVADEPRVLSACGGHLRHQPVAQHHPVTRLHHVRRAARLRHDHARHVIIRDAEVEGGRVVVLLVRTRHVTIRRAVDGHAPGRAARDGRPNRQRHPHLNVMRRARRPGHRSVTDSQSRRECAAVVPHNRNPAARHRRRVAVLRIDHRSQPKGGIRQQIIGVRRVAEGHAVQAHRPGRPGNHRTRQREHGVRVGARAGVAGDVLARHEGERRAAHHHFTARHRRRHEGAEIAAHRGRHSAPHIVVRHADKGVRRTGDPMLDARVMETFLRRVLHCAHRHRLRREPVAGRESQRREWSQRAVQRVQLPVVLQLNCHRAGRSLRQHHAVSVGRIRRTVVPAFRDQILRAARQHQHFCRVVINDVHGQARSRQPVVGPAVIRAAALHH